MKQDRAVAIAGLIVGLSCIGIAAAVAAVPYWTNWAPLATPPLTGVERVPADTYLAGSTAPQQEGITTLQLESYVSSVMLTAANAWTGAQSDGAGGSGLVPVYNGTGTLKTGVKVHAVALTQALTAGAATVTLTGDSVYAVTPVCVGSDQTAANPVRVEATSTSSITLVGTGADVIAVECLGA